LQEGKDSDFDVRARECGQYVSTPMLDVVLKSYLVSPPTYNSMSIMFDPVSSCIILYHPVFSSYIYIRNSSFFVISGTSRCDKVQKCDSIQKGFA
jgi:hypothetical protein